jgi:hypothetical protein
MSEGPHPTPQSASTLNGLGSSSRLVLKRLTNFSAVLPGGADLKRGQPDAPEELRNEARRLDVSAPDARRPSTVEGRLQNNTDSQRLRVKTARRRHIRPSTVEGRSPDQPAWPNPSIGRVDRDRRRRPHRERGHTRRQARDPQWLRVLPGPGSARAPFRSVGARTCETVPSTGRMERVLEAPWPTVLFVVVP